MIEYLIRSRMSFMEEFLKASKIVSTVIWEATSPALFPPKPSQTINNVPP